MSLEVTTGIALILGIWPRLAALVAFPILVGAIVFFHGRNGFAYNAPKGADGSTPHARSGSRGLRYVYKILLTDIYKRYIVIAFDLTI